MMTSWLNLLTMGCICTRESVDINRRRFYVRTRLGEGGFSFVDLVEDSSRRQYALKRISCHSKLDEEVALAEVEYMRKLKHRNLVALEEAECVPVNSRTLSIISEVLIVMPFFRRGTLFNETEMLSKKGDRMRESRLLKIFRGICEGLRYLHTHKPDPIAHRDMKPHNVLMAEDDTPVLMDFGSMGPARIEIKGASEARALQDLAAERCSMPYRAPELFNVESYGTVDERIDIWSLGCTLYAMCFHESPFDKAYMRGDSVALAVLGGNIKFPENTVYSQELRDLTLSMLHVDAMERPYIDWVIDRTENMLNKLDNRI